MANKKKLTYLVMTLAILIASCNMSLAFDENNFEVVNGATEVSRNENIVTFNSTDNAILNFNSFDIEKDETVIFNLPSNSSKILTRVTGNSCSKIYGSLICPGEFFHVNENGIHVGQDAKINVGSLVLSTRDITDSDFIDGRYLFNKMKEMDMLLLNEGEIKIHEGGFGILIAGASSNEGIISAPCGTISLASGEAIRIGIADRGRISIAVEKEQAHEVIGFDGRPITDQMSSTGQINATGGMVALRASSLPTLFEKAINLEGFIKATRITQEGGIVSITAGGNIRQAADIEAEEIVIVSEEGDIDIDNIMCADKITIDAAKGSVRQIGGLHIDGGYLKVAANFLDLTSCADTTHLVIPEGDLVIDSLIQLGEELVELGTSRGKVSYLVNSDLVIEVPLGDVDAAAGVMIPGHQVKISAKRIGSRDNPVGINADLTYINRIQGDIDISEIWGMGTTITIRGPAPSPGDDPWGAVTYTNDSHLILEAEKTHLSTDGPTNLLGNITFFNFECTTPGKEIYFEAGKTYTFLGTLKLQGAYAQHIKLLSSVEGEHWYIDPQGERDITYTWVEDSYNIHPDEIIMIESTNRGNCYNWDPTGYWVGGTDNNWSTGSNWSGLGGAKPGAGDDVVFNSTYSVNDTSIIDEAFTINSLTIDSTWSSGTITQTGNLTVTADYDQDGGTFTCADPTTYTFSVGGSFSIDETTADFDRYTGAGIEADPYIVRDVYDLQAVKCDLDVYYEQAANIDASLSISWNSGSGFIPINNFASTYDGKGYKVTGLYINNNNYYKGLFGYLTGSGITIKNLGVTGDVTGNAYVGGLAGYVGGSVLISNCYSEVNVNGGSYIGGLVGYILNDSGSGYGLVDSYATGEVTSTGGSVGGLIGYGRSSTVTRSYSTGAVSGSGNIGGLIGTANNGCNISNSFSTGSVSGSSNIGGFVGHLSYSSSVSGCYSSGAVTGGSSIGGFVGFAESNYGVDNCYATGDVNTAGGSYVGGFVGKTYGNGDIRRCYSTGDVNSDTGDYVGGFGGYTSGGYSSGGNFNNSFETGSVTATGDNIGGFIGYMADKYTCDTCYYTDSHENDYGTHVDTGESTFYGTSHDVYNTGSYLWEFGTIWVPLSADFPHLIKTLPVYTWDGEGSTNNWSEAANWDKDLVPVALSRVVFDDTSVKDSTIDTDFNAENSIAVFSINSGYTGTITFGTDLTVYGDFSQSAGALALGDHDVSVAGNAVFSGGSLTAGLNSSVFTLNGTTDQDLTATLSHQFGIFAINNTGAAGSDNIILSGTLFSYGLNFTDGHLDLSVNNPDMKIYLNTTVGALATVTKGTGAITFAGGGVYTDNAGGMTNFGNIGIGNVPGQYSLGSNMTCDSFTINPSALYEFYTNGYDINCLGDLSITNGYFYATGSGGRISTISVAGNWTLTGGAFTGGDSTVRFIGTSDQTITNGATFYNLEINNTGTAGSDDVIINGTLTANGTFTIEDGDLDLSTYNPNIYIGGDFTINGGSVTKGSGWVNFGVSALSGTTITYTDNVGVDIGRVFVGYTNRYYTFNLASGLTCSELNVNDGVGGVTTFNTKGYDVDNSGGLDLFGKLDATGTGGRASDIYIGGNWYVRTSGVFTAGNSNVIFDGSGARSVTPRGYAFNDFTASGSDTLTLVGDIEIDGDYDQTSGTVEGDYTKAFNVDGSFSLSDSAIFNRFSGAGAEGDPYIVRDIFDLQAVKCYTSAYFEQGTDIVATPARGWNSNGSGGYYGFYPIKNFNGSYDGKGHTINDFYINRPNTDFVGLFANTLDSPTSYLHNITISSGNITGRDATGSLVGWLHAGSIINSSSAADVAGRYSVGGLIGQAKNSQISSSFATGNVLSGIAYVGGFVGYIETTTVSSSYATGSVTGSGNYVGGFIGWNAWSGNITTSYATGTVLGLRQVGGFVGQNGDPYISHAFQNASITKCYSTGSVSGEAYVGGFAGFLSHYSNPVTDCYASGNITGTVGSSYSIGGFAGQIQGNENSYVYVRRCYAEGDVSGDTWVGGFTGYNDTYVIVYNSYATGDVTGTTEVGGFAGRVTWSPQQDPVDCYYTDVNHQNGYGTYEANGKSAFYGRSHDVYTQGTYSWDFNNTWAAYVALLPRLRFQQFEVPITISGIYYTSEGTPYSGAALTLNVYKDKTLVGTTDTTDGNFSFTNVNVYVESDLLILTAGDVSNRSNLVTISPTLGGTDISGLSMYRDTIVLRHENAGPITNADMIAAHVNGAMYTIILGSISRFNGELRVASGFTYDIGSDTCNADDLHNDGTITASSGRIIIRGDLDLRDSVFTTSNTLIQFATSGGNNIYTNGQNLGSIQLWYNAIPGCPTVTLQSDIIVENVTLDEDPSGGTDSVLDSNGFNITVGGSWTNNGDFLETTSTVDFTSSSGTVTLNRHGGTEMETFYNLTHSGAGTLSVASDGLRINNDFENSGGTFDANGEAMYVGGNWTNSATFTHNDNAVTFEGTQAGKTITTGGSSFYDLTFDGSGGEWTLQDAITVANDLTLTNGTLDVSGSDYGITVGGSLAATNGSLSTQEGTVTFTGTASNDESLTPAGIDFYNVTFNGSGVEWTLQDELQVDAVLTISNGTLFLNGNDLTFNATPPTTPTFVNNDTLKLVGSETLSNFTNDTDSGIVKYAGTGSYTGLAAGNSYYDLYFGGAGTYTLTEDVDVNGDLTFRTLEYTQTITINSSQVAETLDDYPMLFSYESENLKTVANGGKVYNENGYDILLKNSQGDLLDFQIEKYDPVNGVYIAWVKIPTLSSTQDTDIKLSYGDSTITSSQEHATDVWDSDFTGIYHLNESSGTIADSTTKGNSGDSQSGITYGATGKIGEAISLTGGSGVNINSYSPSVSEMTISSWVTAGTTSVNNRVIFGAGGESGYQMQGNASNGNIGCYVGGSELQTSWALQTSTWIYMTATFDGSTIRLYKDGILIDAKGGGSPSGNFSATIGNKWYGLIDELQVSSTARTAGWIETSYNNQNNPSSFFTPGAPSGGGGGGPTTVNMQNYAMNIGGNFDNQNSSVLSGQGTVEFDDAGQTSSITGANSFYNLTCQTAGKTITFEADSTQTVNNNFIINSSGPARINLRSSSSGTAWKIDPQGALTCIGVDAQDSNNINAAAIDAYGSYDRGNNANWNFVGYTWVGITSTDWNTGTNWQYGFVPSTGQNITITDGTNHAVLDTARTVGSLTIETDAMLDLDGNDFTLNSTFSNDGTLQLEGGENLTGFTNDTNSGLVEYSGTGTYSTLAAGNTYYDLTFDGTGTWSADGDLTVLHNLTIADGTLDMSSAGLSIGNVMDISSSSSADATLKSSQRKTFYDTLNEYYWAFYYTGSAVEGAYSSDGSTWTTVAGSAVATTDFTVFYKNINSTAYLYLALTYDSDIYVISRTITGTTLGPATQGIALDGTSSAPFSSPSIALDANNYVWAAGIKDYGTDYADRYQVCTNRSSSVNDVTSWGTASAVDRAYADVNDVILMPRTGAEMYLLTNNAENNILGYIYNGATWSDANTGGDLSWFTFPGISGGGANFNGAVYAIEISGTDLYVGGAFTKVGDTTLNYIGRWNGVAWSALGSGLNGVVRTIAADPSGNVYAGGDFTDVSGGPGGTYNYIAKWDGSWNALGSGVNGIVRDVITGPGTNVFVGGDFTSAGVAGTSYLATWNGSGWSNTYSASINNKVYCLEYVVADIGFGPTDIVLVGGEFTNPSSYLAEYVGGFGWVPITGLTGPVYTTSIDLSNEVGLGGGVYVGGNFTGIDIGGGQTADYLVFTADGANWSAVGSGNAINAPIRSLYVSGGSIYAGGDFTDGGAVSDADYIAGYNSTSGWSALGSGTNNSVYAIGVSGTDVYAGGAFTEAGGNSIPYLSKWNGSIWSAVESPHIVRAVAVDGSTVYIGGTFADIGGVDAAYLAQWNGTSWSALTGGSPNNSVYALEFYNNELYVGGSFSQVGATSANGIAKYDPNSDTWSVFSDTVTGINGVSGGASKVNAIYNDTTNGYLFAGGDFTQAGGKSANYVAYWDGSNWGAILETTTGGIDSGGEVNTLTSIYVSSFGVYEVLVGGSFPSMNGGDTSRAYFGAAIYAGGIIPYWVEAAINGNGEINAIIGYDDYVYLGGAFTSFNGVSANRIVKITVSTSVVEALGDGANASVSCLYRSGDYIYVGGEFTQAGGDSSIQYLAKYDTTNPGNSGWSKVGTTGLNGTVLAVTMSSAGEVYAGGTFTQADGNDWPYIAKYGFDWSSLSSGAGLNGEVKDLTFLGTDLYVGGSFMQAGGNASQYLARWDTVSSSWTTFGTDLDGEVLALYADTSNNLLYVGGNFTNAGGVAANHIAVCDVSDPLNPSWSGLGSAGNYGVDGTVRTIQYATSAGTPYYYIGGDFINAQDGTTLNYIGVYNPATFTWSDFYGGVNGRVYDLFVFDMGGGAMLMTPGGEFTASTTGITMNYSGLYYPGTPNGWSTLPDNGLNDFVYSVEFTGSGVIYGGKFTATNGGATALSHLAFTDANAWYPLGAGVNGDVKDMCFNSSNDQLLVVGDFTTAGGTLTVNNTAVCDLSNFPTVVWSAAGSGTNNTVNAITTSSGGDAYLGGNFTRSGTGSTVEYVSKYALGWHSMSSAGSGGGSVTYGINGEVNAIAINGLDVYLGGDFTQVGNITANRIAKFNTLTGEWSTFGDGMDDRIYTIAISPTGVVYAGGIFSTAGGKAIPSIAKWTGSEWTDVAGGVTGSIIVLGQGVYGLEFIGDDLYVGGAFTGPGSCIAKYTPSTDQWMALGDGISGTPVYFIYGLEALGADLYASGYFTSAGGQSANSIAKYDTTQTGNAGWSALGDGITGVGGSLNYPFVYGLAVKGTDLYVGGQFSTAGTTAVNCVAKYDTTFGDSNAGWSALGDGVSGADPLIMNIAVVGDYVYFGGTFTIAGGTSVNRIVRYDTTKTGNLGWEAVGVGVAGGGSGIFNQTAVLDFGVLGTDLFIGGDFTSAGGNSSNFLAKYGLAAASGTNATTEVSAVSDSTGDIHLLYTDSSDNLKYKRYDYTTSSWQTVEGLQTGTVTSPSVAIDPSSGDLYAVWLESNVLRTKKSTSGTWDTNPTTLYSTGTNFNISPNYYIYDEKLALAWTNGAASPYNVMHGIISGPTVTVGGNWTNRGDFTPGVSTVVFDPVSSIVPFTVLGDTTFYNLKCTAVGKELHFEDGSTQTITGKFTMTGAAGNLIALRSASAGNYWYVDPQGTVDVTYVDVKDGYNISTTILTSEVTSVDSGHNIRWFPGKNFSGTIYVDEGVTNIGAGKTIAIIVNGDIGLKKTGTTNAVGEYSILGVRVHDGDMVVVYINGETELGSMVTKVAEEHYTGFDVYQNNVIIRDDYAAGVGYLTNMDLANADNAAETDIKFSVASGNLTVTDSQTLYIKASETLNPGGNIASPALKVEGELNTAGYSIDLGGDLTIGASGTLAATGAGGRTTTISLGGDWVNNDTFTSGTSRVDFDGTSAQGIYSGGIGTGNDFYDLDISNTQAAVSVSNDNVKVTGTLTVDANTSFTLDSNRQVWVDGGSLTLNGTPSYAAVSAIINHNGTTYDYYGGTTGVNKSALISDFDSTDNVTIKAGKLPQNEDAASLSLTIDGGGTYDVLSGDFGTGSVTVISNGTWKNHSDSDVTLSGNVSNAGTIDFDGTTGDGILIRSSAAGTRRNWQGSGTFNFTDVDVKDQSCIGGNPAYIEVSSGTDSGNNVNWLFENATVITGSIYDSIGGTKVDVLGNTVVVVINNESTIYQADTDANGDYRIVISGLDPDDVVTLYFDTAGTGASTTTNVKDDSSLSLNLYENVVTVRSETGANPLYTADLRTLELNPSVDTDMLHYDTDAGNNLTVENGYTLYVETGLFNPSADVTITDDLRVDGTLNINDGTVTVAGGNDAIINGTVNLDDDNSVLDISGGLDLNGTLDLSGQDGEVEVGGDLDATGGTFNKGTGTVVFDGGNSQDIISAGNDFGDVEVRGPLTTLVMQDKLEVDDINMNGGTVNTGTNTLTVGGDFTNNGGFTSNGTVVFDDAQQTSNITGSTTFYDLLVTTPRKELIFEAGVEQIVANSLVVDSATDGEMIEVKSSVPGTQFKIKTPVSTNLDYVEMWDGNNTGAATVYSPTSIFHNCSGFARTSDSSVAEATRENDNQKAREEIEREVVKSFDPAEEFIRFALSVGPTSRLALDDDLSDCIYVPFLPSRYVKEYGLDRTLPFYELESEMYNERMRLYVRRYLPSKYTMKVEMLPDGIVKLFFVSRHALV